MDNLSFENALQQIENIVSSLESGELSLEQSLKVYEQGITLTKFCNSQLKNAKLKVEELKAGSNNENV
ncbi:MAG: exodeoxyribonuclease VII small subunit [Oscillospiraceae bacterium]